MSHAQSRPAPARTAARLALDLLPTVLTAYHDADRALLHDQLSARASELHDISQRIAKALGTSEHVGRTLEAICRDLDETAELVDQLADAVLLPFMLFVVGMGKFGKSTLTNALLGARMADMDALPKTWKIDIFTARAEPDAVLVKTREGERKTMTPAEARELLADEEERREDSEDEIERHFRERSRSLSTVEEREELKAYLRNELLYESPISEVHWPATRSRLLDRFNLIDTPGLFQQLLAERTKADVRDYYHKADGVLWLLDATKLASASPARLMDDLEEALAEVGGRTDNIIAVLNRMDLAAPDAEARSRLIEEAHRIFPERFLAIVPFSAKLALEAVEANDREALRESGHTALMEAIERHFVSRAVRLQKRSKLLGLRGYVHDVAGRVEEYAERLETAHQQRAQMVAELSSALAEFERRIRDRRRTLSERYAADVRIRIEHRTERFFELETEAQRSAFLREEIFERTRLEAWIAEIAALMEREAALLFEIQRDKSLFKEYEHLELEDLPTRGHGHPRMETRDIDLDYEPRLDQALLGGAGALGAALLLAPQAALLGLLAFTDIGKWAARKMRTLRMRPKLEAQLDEMVAKAGGELEAHLRTLSREVRDRINTIRDSSFEEVYCAPARATEVVKHLRQVPAIGERALERPVLEQVIAGRLSNGR